MLFGHGTCSRTVGCQLCVHDAYLAQVDPRPCSHVSGSTLVFACALPLCSLESLCFRGVCPACALLLPPRQSTRPLASPDHDPAIGEVSNSELHAVESRFKAAPQPFAISDSVWLPPMPAKLNLQDDDLGRKKARQTDAVFSSALFAPAPGHGPRSTASSTSTTKTDQGHQWTRSMAQLSVSSSQPFGQGLQHGADVFSASRFAPTPGLSFSRAPQRPFMLSEASDQGSTKLVRIAPSQRQAGVTVIPPTDGGGLSVKRCRAR